MRHMFSKIFGLLLVGSLFLACSTEYQVATDYVEKLSIATEQDEQMIYVVLPQEVIHTNRTISQMPDFLNLPVATQDSLIKINTLFLDKVNDSILLAQFSRNFLYNLSRLKIPINVCKTSLEFPKQVSDKVMTINVAQLELEEFNTTGELIYTNNDYKEKYYRTVPLKGVSLNVWFSYNESDTNQRKVYYKDLEITDDLEGDIKPQNTGKAEANYKVMKLNLNDIYYTPYALARVTATLFIEKMINDHVSTTLGRTSPYYYFYNTEKEKVDGSVYKSNLNPDYLLQEIKKD